MQNNRQRRAAEARRRRRRTASRTARASSPDPDLAGLLADAVEELLEIVRRRAMGLPSHAATFFARPVAFQLTAAAEVVLRLVTRAIANGWSDTDLCEVTRRRLPVAAAGLLPDLLDDLRGGRPWRALHELRESPADLDRLVATAVLLCGLPALPAQADAPADGAEHDVDERILRKVRVLLAKAESTEYEAEAETLTEKAQQLMSKYSIERSLAESTRADRAAGPRLRRMWVDAPYVSPKSSLIGAVARANHCRCIETSEWGFVSLVGHGADLEIVELLATSLLLQASRAMTLAGSHTDRYGNSQTRSFRSSFLLAYAARIGERLHETSQVAEDEASASTGGGLVPVLAARDGAVDAEVDQLFPDLVRRRARISNARGWGAGRAAADLARLDRRGSIAG